MVSVNNKMVKYLMVILFLGCLNSLIAIQLPVFFHWRSSNSGLFYDFSKWDTSRAKEHYKINTGIDTLLSDGIRTYLDLTNQDKILESQIVIKEASIEYNNDKMSLQLAIQDFGYGSTFKLYNRRNDDYYFGENMLYNNRWHGMHAGYKSGNYTLGAGIGGNELNWSVFEANVKYQYDRSSLVLYHNYVHKESFYSVIAYDFGAEVIIDKDWICIHSGYNYHYLPESRHLPAIDSWININELNLPLSQWMKLTLSSSMKTNTEDSKINHIYEGSFDFIRNRFHNTLGVRKQNLISSNTYTTFLDSNYFIRKNLMIGIFIDYVNIIPQDSYFKFGFQTNYALD